MWRLSTLSLTVKCGRNSTTLACAQTTYEFLWCCSFQNIERWVETAITDSFLKEKFVVLFCSLKKWDFFFDISQIFFLPRILLDFKKTLKSSYIALLKWKNFLEYVLFSHEKRTLFRNLCRWETKFEYFLYAITILKENKSKALKDKYLIGKWHPELILEKPVT